MRCICFTFLLFTVFKYIRRAIKCMNAILNYLLIFIKHHIHYDKVKELTGKLWNLKKMWNVVSCFFLSVRIISISRIEYHRMLFCLEMALIRQLMFLSCFFSPFIWMSCDIRTYVHETQMYDVANDVAYAM